MPWPFSQAMITSTISMFCCHTSLLNALNIYAINSMTGETHHTNLLWLFVYFLQFLTPHIIQESA